VATRQGRCASLREPATPAGPWTGSRCRGRSWCQCASRPGRLFGDGGRAPIPEQSASVRRCGASRAGPSGGKRSWTHPLTSTYR
jgi:hypothetical protein